MRFKIDRASLIVEGNLPVLLCFTLYLRAISKYKPPGGLYLEGFIHGGAYFRNFTIYQSAWQVFKRKGETRASAPGSTFLSLSNACYAGYIYLFITYLFRLYLVCSAFLYLYLLIIPLSLFLKKKCLVKDRMTIGVASPGACFKTTHQALCLFIYLFIHLFSFSLQN